MSEKEKENIPGNKVQFAEYPCPDGITRRLVKKVGGAEVIVRFDKTHLPKKPTDVFCPHFLELKWATGCPYNCSWCYLQGTMRMLPYKTKPTVKDMDRTTQHLKALFYSKSQPEILNSGELSDSLIAKDRLPTILKIADLFNEQQRHRLLIVTKSDLIASFLERHRDNVVFSFSLNPDKVAKRWERGAPPPLDRIVAAKKLSEAGYEVRIRVDPIVPIEGWQLEYQTLVSQVCKAFDPDRITLGTLRGLKTTLNNSKDDSWQPYLKEKTSWGLKMPLQTRLDAYRIILEQFGQFGFHDVAVCKDTLEVLKRLGINWRAMKCNCLW